MGWYKALHEFFSEPFFVDGDLVNLSDRIAVTISRFLYLVLRISLRVLIGKKKRDRLIAERGFSYINILRQIHPQPILVKAKDGLFWCRIGVDYMTDLIVMSDLHEPWFLNIFKPKLGDIVLDLGAHIGRYSLIAGKLVGDKGKVIAVEADPRNYSLLQLNIKTNGLHNIVHAINAASWKESTTIALFRDLFSGRHSVCRTSDNYVEVDTITVDELMCQYNLPRIDWMKVDVEGAEYATLLGAKDTISNKKIKFILLEIHGHEMLNLTTQLLSPLYKMDIIRKMDDDRYYVNAELL